MRTLAGAAGRRADPYHWLSYRLAKQIGTCKSGACSVHTPLDPWDDGSLRPPLLGRAFSAMCGSSRMAASSALTTAGSACAFTTAGPCTNSKMRPARGAPAARSSTPSSSVPAAARGLRSPKARLPWALTLALNPTCTPPHAVTPAAGASARMHTKLSKTHTSPGRHA